MISRSIPCILISEILWYSSESKSWWHHQMEIFSALLAFCAGKSPVTGEFPTQRPVTQSFDVFFDLRLSKWLSKQLRRWWFKMPSHPLWRHYNVIVNTQATILYTELKDCTYYLLSLLPHLPGANELNILEDTWFGYLYQRDFWIGFDGVCAFTIVMGIFVLLRVEELVIVFLWKCFYVSI